MGTNRHAWRFVGQRIIEYSYISQMLTLAVAAQLCNVLSLFWIVEIREAGIVELQIGAAELSECIQLGSVSLREIMPELFHIRINRRINRRAASPIMHHAG